MACGADKDRLLGIDKELSLGGVFPSRRIVNWYNGSLDNDIQEEKDLNFENSRDVIIIGNGNIFCDISRMLLKDAESFNNSDMPESVINSLKRSKIKNIQSVARRGITHAAFTTKEIREISAIPDI